MKKTLSTLSALGTVAFASPAFAHHGGGDSLLSNISHWLSSPMHGLLSLAAIGVCAIAAFKLISKNTQA